MKKTDNLEMAMNYIDDALIEENIAKRESLRKKTNEKKSFRRIAASAVAIALALALLIVPMIKEFNAAYYDSIWQIVSNNGSELMLKTTAKSGMELALCVVISYAPFYKLSNDEKKIAEMVGQWYISLSTLNYDLHFSLFQEEFVYDKFTSIVEEEGFSYDQAIQKLAWFVSCFLPMDYAACPYTLEENRELPLEDLFLHFHEYGIGESFERFGLDIQKISEARVCKFSGGGIVINGVHQDVLGDYENEEMIFYCYDGKWYMSPDWMEDDLSIDITLSDEDSNDGFYQKYWTMGKVVGIENGYVELENGYFYKYSGAEMPKDLCVGETVVITYYNIGYGNFVCAKAITRWEE